MGDRRDKIRFESENRHFLGYGSGYEDSTRDEDNDQSDDGPKIKTAF